MFLLLSTVSKLISIAPDDAWNRDNMLILYHNHKPESFKAKIEFASVLEELEGVDGTIVNCNEFREHCQRNRIYHLPELVYVRDSYHHRYN